MIFGLNVVAHAEGGCPSGSYPIGNRDVAACAPIPGGERGGGGQQQAPSAPSAPVWSNRWGAMAFDSPKGILGAAMGLSSESTAQRAALADCKAKGGTQCKVENSFANSCTAFTIGDRGAYRGVDPVLETVIASGIQKCKEMDKNCETYYSACSRAVRIQ